MTYKNTWDMESVFAGGSNYPQFYDKISTLEDGVKDFNELVNSWEAETDAPDFKHFEGILTTREQLEKGIGETRTFISGLSSADTSDETAKTNLNLVANLS